MDVTATIVAVVYCVMLQKCSGHRGVEKYRALGPFARDYALHIRLVDGASIEMKTLMGVEVLFHL